MRQYPDHIKEGKDGLDGCPIHPVRTLQILFSLRLETTKIFQISQSQTLYECFKVEIKTLSILHTALQEIM